MSVGRNDAVQTNENALARYHMQCPGPDNPPRLRLCLILSRGLGVVRVVNDAVGECAKVV